jgi:hypothetical protein
MIQQNELLLWMDTIHSRQEKNDFNVVDVPASVLLELKRRKFMIDAEVITSEGVKFLEKNKVEHDQSE